MHDLVPLQPVDYVVIGHVAVDITPEGLRLGGTVAYSGLTAKALGYRVGIVTSHGNDAPLEVLKGIQIVSVPSERSTIFENIKTETGRKQILHHRAEPILSEHIPAEWKKVPIIHLAPLARELEPDLPAQISSSLIGITPQGWMRTWDENGRITACSWENSEQALRHAGGVVFSIEDVCHNLEWVEAMAHQTRILCLTEGQAGAVLYWNGDRRRFPADEMSEIDATGAGDIFAAAFFTRLHATRDPWEATRFATKLATRSIVRPGLDGIPTQAEIEECLMEVLS
jgi:sugar/nucleoside kinase (ribokinase family)